MAVEDEVLSLSNTGCEDNLDEDLVAVITRAAREIQDNTSKPVKGRIIRGGTLSTKRKTQSKDKGSKYKLPKKAQVNDNPSENIDDFRAKLGINSLEKCISSLNRTHKVQVILMTIRL